MRRVVRVARERRGEFVSPMTEARFLTSPLVQYNALSESLRRYDAALPEKLPEGVTRSGALALLHHLGAEALEKWAATRNRSTIDLFERANGLF